MPRYRSSRRPRFGYADIALCAAAAFGGTWYFADRIEYLSLSPEERLAIETSVYYSGCDEVRMLGRDPIYRGEPGYRLGMDGDGDGIACEPYR